MGCGRILGPLTADLRIAVDATVVSQRLKGAGRVATNLVATLPEVDQESTYLALATPGGAAILDGRTSAEVVVVPEMPGVRWELWEMGAAARNSRADLVLTFREFVGFGGPPTVMHVFEPPAYRLDPREGHRRPVKHRAKDRLLQAALRGSIRRAAAVTAGSVPTAVWLERQYGMAPKVVPPGIDPFFLSEDSGQVEVAPEPYFLHPASGDPRENTDLALRAFARMGVRGVRLRTVGTPDGEVSAIERRARELGISDSVEVEGWVSDERLRALYRGAVALVHPTRYEGFGGYPALEAMAQGTPVVDPSGPGTVEALRSAALLIEHEDAEELAEALRRLSADTALANSLANRGRELARALTWEATARAFVAVFRNVLGPRPPEARGAQS
jgi:glycosyltransferase involved in cell wall biosynthesis